MNIWLTDLRSNLSKTGLFFAMAIIIGGTYGHEGLVRCKGSTGSAYQEKRINLESLYGGEKLC